MQHAKHIPVSLLFLFMVMTATGQDIHFSQFNMSPLNLNPAYTGQFDGAIRFVGNHKNQWQSVTSPYKTLSGSVDTRLNHYKLPKTALGIGFLGNTDKAGDSRYGKNQYGLSLALHQYMGHNNKLQLSLGYLLTRVSSGLDYSALTFDSNWNGSSYDGSQGIPTGLTDVDHSYIDHSAGISGAYQLNKRLNLKLGGAWHHFKTVNESLLDGATEVLPTKYTAHGGMGITMGAHFTLMPAILFMQQAGAYELAFGSGFRFATDKNKYLTAFRLGGWYRHMDATIMQLVLENDKLQLGLSYDFNTSKLASASSGLGGFELAIIYVFKIKGAPRVPYKACPTFI